MLSRDDIIELMQEAGWKEWHDGLWGNGHDGCMFLRALERFAKLVYEAGAAAERERIIAANAPEIERINAHIEGMRDRMISEGWRQCAQGQKTTQFCAVAEQARLEEREKFCAALRLLHDSYSLSSDAKDPDDGNPSF